VSDKLPAGEGQAQAAVERSRKALKGDDMGEIRAAQEDLNKTFSGLVSRSRAVQNAGRRHWRNGRSRWRNPARRQLRRTKPADDVVEADYEIVDEQE
jgi:molecular chaperone DnaK